MLLHSTSYDCFKNFEDLIFVVDKLLYIQTVHVCYQLLAVIYKFFLPEDAHSLHRFLTPAGWY